MSVCTRVVVIAALIVSCAGVAGAQSSGGFYSYQAERVTNRNKQAGTSLITAGSNILYVPFRFAVTSVVGVVGGATGFLLAGDREGAQDVWGLTDGQSILTQEVMQGKEPLYFGEYQAHIHVTPQAE